MTKVRLEQHIRECFAKGAVSVRSEKDYWNEQDCFSLCSFKLFERNPKTGYNEDLSSYIAPGSWILSRPYQVGWFWDRKWYIRCEKFNGSRFELVTGFTQKEMDSLAQLWLRHAQYLIAREKESIQEARQDRSDKSAWHP